MKKYTLLMLLAASLVSCKKDYNCECRDPKTNDHLFDTRINKTRKAASNACDTYDIPNVRNCSLT